MSASSLSKSGPSNSVTLVAVLGATTASFEVPASKPRGGVANKPPGRATNGNERSWDPDSWRRACAVLYPPWPQYKHTGRQKTP